MPQTDRYGYERSLARQYAQKDAARFLTGKLPESLPELLARKQELLEEARRNGFADNIAHLEEYLQTFKLLIGYVEVQEVKAEQHA